MWPTSSIGFLVATVAASLSGALAYQATKLKPPVTNNKVEEVRVDSKAAADTASATCDKATYSQQGNIVSKVILTGALTGGAVGNSHGLPEYAVSPANQADHSLIHFSTDGTNPAINPHPNPQINPANTQGQHNGTIDGLVDTTPSTEVEDAE